MSKCIYIIGQLYDVSFTCGNLCEFRVQRTLNYSFTGCLHLHLQCICKLLVYPLLVLYVGCDSILSEESPGMKTVRFHLANGKSEAKQPRRKTSKTNASKKRKKTRELEEDDDEYEVEAIVAHRKVGA